MTRTARRLIRILAYLVKDQRGGEVIEYAIIASMIVIGAIATVSCVGSKVLAKWTSLDSKM